MSLGKSVSNFIRDQRLSAAKRTLESELTQIINLCEGHKSNDLPVGHQYYVLLQHKADDVIAKYQVKQAELGVTASTNEEIAATVPALRTINCLADGKQEPSAAIKVTLIAAFGGTFATFVIAMYHNLYVLLTHAVNARVH